MSNFPWLTVAGVVANTSFRALAEAAPVPMMYMPLLVSRAAGIVRHPSSHERTAETFR